MLRKKMFPLFITGFYIVVLSLINIPDIIASQGSAELKFLRHSVSPETPLPGGRFSIEVSIQNAGKGKADSFRVEARSGQTTLGVTEFKGLSGGARDSQSISLTYPDKKGEICLDLIINPLKNKDARVDSPRRVCVSAKTIAQPQPLPQQPPSPGEEPSIPIQPQIPTPSKPEAPLKPIEIKIASLDVNKGKFELELENKDKKRDLRNPLVEVEINQAGKKRQIYKDHLPILPADGTRMIRIPVPEDTKPTDSLEIKVNKMLIGKKGLKGLIEPQLDPHIPDRPQPMPLPLPEPIPDRPLPEPIPDRRPPDRPLPRPLVCTPPDRVIYVDAATGDDSAHSGGRPECAFKTITRAIAMARSGQRIQVAAGVYDATLGERFPLVLPEGVQLAGVGYPVIRGGDRYPAAGEKLFAVVTTNETNLTGFEVSNPVGVAVLCHGRSVIRGNLLIGSGYAGASTYPPCTGQVEDNIVMQNPFGITTWGSSSPTITRNSIAGNRVGIDTTGTSSAFISRNYLNENSQVGVKVNDRSLPMLRENNIRENSRGVWVQSEEAQPNLGTSELSGGNVLSCNSFSDLEVRVIAGRTLRARGNLWDHVPPSSTDVVISGGGRLDTEGARLSSSACPVDEGSGFAVAGEFAELMVTSFRVEPSEARLGDGLRAVARIRNLSVRVVGPVEVGLYAAPVPTLGYGPPWEPTLIAVTTITDTFETETVEFRVPTPLPGVLSESGHSAGRFYLWVQVDHSNRIEELNERNNRSESVQILIRSAP